MLSKRYHIHLICAIDDQAELLDHMAIFMENRAFITYDLGLGTPESTKYSRRRIDDCDFTIVLLGDSYGPLNNTGVSQMHLSYIYAKTKAKPMMILLKMHDDDHKAVKLTRQLVDFAKMVEKQNEGSVYYYGDDIDLHEFMLPLYEKFIRQHTCFGWVKGTTSKRLLNVSEQASLNKSTQANQSLPKHTVVNNKEQDKPHVNAIVNDQTSTDQTSKDKAIHQVVDVPKIIKAPDVDSPTTIRFSTHAYEGGNLSDITLKASITWREILAALCYAFEATVTPSFQRIINELVNEKALSLVQKKHPAVHAVSRTQVSVNDLERLQALLLKFGWFEIVKHPGENSSQTWLELSNRAKKAIA